MKKILSNDEKERIRKRNSRFVAAFMLIIMLGSTAGYAFFSYGGNKGTSNTNNNNGQDINGRYIAQYNGQQLIFSNSPESTKDVSVSILKDLTDYAGKDVYIDAESPLDSEIASTLGLYTQKLQRACYGPCEANLPEKDCSSNIIVFRKADVNRVYENSSCLFVEGDMKAVDAFLFRIFKLS